MMKHYDQKQFVEKKVYLSLHFHITVHLRRQSGKELKQNRNLEAGTDARPWRGTAHSSVPHGLLSLLLYRRAPGPSLTITN